MDELNRLLLTATLLIGGIFSLLLVQPVAAAISYLLTN
jgi:hypothetical protein